jgi:proteasome lid subunit RPN8/RPN11
LFKRDGISSQEDLDNIVAASGGAIDYLGEWHSHPCDVGPSNKDLSAMKWIANNPQYAVGTPILGLCIKRAFGEWEFELFRCIGGSLVPIPVRVVSQEILSAGFMSSM